MTKTIAFIGTMALAMVLAFSSTSVLAADDMAAQISAAKTAADHEALAAAYDKQAQEAEARAAEHDKMAASYKGLGKIGQVHETHCAAIAKRERESAKDSKGLAASHREQAKAAK